MDFGPVGRGERVLTFYTEACFVGTLHWMAVPHTHVLTIDYNVNSI